MQARGQLMAEHRLIERMLALIRQALEQIESEGAVDHYFVDTVVDFLRMYADRTHHGKEEDILFRNLNERPMSADDRRLMDELIREHVFERQSLEALADANTRYRNGDSDALAGIAENFRILVDFYPRHIFKEDKVFFPAARVYFTEVEDQAMLSEFWEFDRKMIHENYRLVVEGLKASR